MREPSDNGDALPSRGAEQETTDDTTTMKHEGLCDHCGVIEFDEHPDGEFGPECPGCGSVLRVVQEVNAEDVTEDALDADVLAEAREGLAMMDSDFETADAPRQSQMVREAVDAGF